MVSGSFGYADIAVIAIFALFILVCCLRGFAKSFNGLFCTIIAIIISFLIVGAITDKLIDSKIGVALNNKLTESSQSWGEVFTSPAKIEDGNVYIQVEGSWVNMVEASSNKIQGFFASKIAPKFITTSGAEGEPVQTLAGQIMTNLTALIIAACTFVILIIVILIIFAILRKIIRRIAEEHTTIKIIDKILGAVLGAFFGLMLIWIGCAILQACQGIGQTDSIISTYIAPCKIANFFYSHNYIGDLFEKIFVAH